jgi:hypothetical protein
VSAAQSSTCSLVRPTRRTCPCTLANVRPNSQQSAPLLAVSWARQRSKRIDKKRQRCSAPTSMAGPTLGGCLPRAPSSCPHSRTRIGACMPALLLAAPCSPYCCLPALCCCLSAPCYLPVPCCAPTSAHLVAPPCARGTGYALRNTCNMENLLQHTSKIDETFEHMLATYVCSLCNMCNIQIKHLQHMSENN